MREADRIRLREAFRLAKEVGDEAWPGWSKAPFAVLLVTPDREFLIRHPAPSADFKPLGYDRLLESAVFVRSRTYSPSFLATFPVVGTIPTIVVGQPERTAAKTSTCWVLAVIHEHFHQLQDSQPHAYRAAEALGLSRGDRTGMWMLNFPFPYKSPRVADLVEALAEAVAEAIETGDSGAFTRKAAAVGSAHARLRESLSKDDYTYLSFQLWKEGVARYTELRMAELAAARYTPTREFSTRPDYVAFAAEAARLRELISIELRDMDLAARERRAFYSLGAGEALVLGRATPNWKRRYLAERFSLDSFISKLGSSAE
jgi:hypothetical protein